MPDINTIPPASLLQQQLTALNQAIFSLNNGAGVQGLSVSSPPRLDEARTREAGGSSLVPPTAVWIMPPITDPDDVATVTVLLQNQADRITQKLVEMGYTESRTAGALWGAPQLEVFGQLPMPPDPPVPGPVPPPPPLVIAPPLPPPSETPPPPTEPAQPTGGGAFPKPPDNLPPTPHPPLTPSGAAAAASATARPQLDPNRPQRFEVTVEPSPDA
jgi:hypothetical protein